MLVRSKVVPSAVQTGCSNGWRDTAQKLKGSRLKLAAGPFDLRAFAPADAPKASSLDHSLWVICSTRGQRHVTDAVVVRITYVQLVSAYRSVSKLSFVCACVDFYLCPLSRFARMYICSQRTVSRSTSTEDEEMGMTCDCMRTGTDFSGPFRYNAVCCKQPEANHMPRCSLRTPNDSLPPATPHTDPDHNTDRETKRGIQSQTCLPCQAA